MQICSYFYIPLVIFCRSLKGVVKCLCWIVNHFIEGKVNTCVFKCLCKNVFLEEQMNLLNFEMHGDFMKTEFHLTMDMIFCPYYFIEYEFHHVYFLCSTWSLYKNLLTFTFKNLWWKDTRKMRVGSVLSFLCQMAEHPHWLFQHSFI